MTVRDNGHYRAVRVVPALFLGAVLALSLYDITRHRRRFQRERDENLPVTLGELGWRRWLAREFDLLPTRDRFAVYLIGGILVLGLAIRGLQALGS